MECLYLCFVIQVVIGADRLEDQKKVNRKIAPRWGATEKRSKNSPIKPLPKWGQRKKTENSKKDRKIDY